jgi:uncharacterized membrane protein YoaK (UPF0700 family)
VDASGFLATGGLFVSFMSGNSTRLGVSAAEQQFQLAGMIFGIVAIFVLGVVIGSIIARRVEHRRKAAVLAFVASSLACAALCWSLSLTYLGTAFTVLAMGAENTIFQRDGEVSIGLTYMTGTLVKLGQQIAAMSFGGPKNTWLPYATHWLGLVSGATLGAAGHTAFRAHSLWPAVIAAFGLIGVAMRLQPKAS